MERTSGTVVAATKSEVERAGGTAGGGGVSAKAERADSIDFKRSTKFETAQGERESGTKGTRDNKDVQCL